MLSFVYRMATLGTLITRKSLLTLAALTLVNSGCNETSFSGSGSGQGQGQLKSGETGTGGTSGGTPFTEEIAVTVNKAGSAAGKVDIIFLVDSSTSMQEERAKLQQSMQGFVAQMVKDYEKLDYQLVMIGQDFQFPELASGRSEVVTKSIASHDALQVLQDFLLSPSLSSIQLRPDAVKEIIVVSDDNAGTNWYDFEAWVKTNGSKTGPLRINGLVGTEQSQQTADCRIASPGTTYQRLTKSPAVGGLVQDICQVDWAPLLSALVKRIAINTTHTEFVLSRPLRRDRQIEVKINDVPVDPSHLTSDYERNAIVLDGSVVTKTGDKVKVTYYAQ